MSGWLKEFREFAVKGNVVDLAVGVIIGAAFGRIVDSLVKDIVMPVVGRIFGGLDDPLGVATIALSAGVCEELFFRGALQTRLGLVWPALVFASVHTQYGLSLDALAVLVLALGLGLLRRFTNTTCTVICHVAYNALVGVGVGWVGWPLAVGLEALLILAALLTTWVAKRPTRA